MILAQGNKCLEYEDRPWKVLLRSFRDLGFFPILTCTLRIISL